MRGASEETLTLAPKDEGQPTKKAPDGANLLGASEETLTLAPKDEGQPTKKAPDGANLLGASEETLTLDLFLGKEAL